jgi:hypothetical protein
MTLGYRAVGVEEVASVRDTPHQCNVKSLIELVGAGKFERPTSRSSSNSAAHSSQSGASFTRKLA